MPLVLSRYHRESVKITVPPSATEQTIEIYVADADRGKVRLSFTADRAVLIDRAEVADRKAAQAKADYTAPLTFCRRCDRLERNCNCHGGPAR